MTRSSLLFFERNKLMKIAVIGSTMMDAVTYTDRAPVAGETRTAHGFHTAGGGKGANQAIAAAKLGADVLFVTMTGDDLFGAACRENYKKAGLDTTCVGTAAGTPNGVAAITVEDDGQNRILITRGANDHLTPEKIAAYEPEIAKCGLIVLQLEVPLATVYAAIDLGVRHHIPVLLNPAPATTDLSIEKACLADYFLPNETELAILTGMPTETEAEIEAAAKKLLDKGLKNVVVTMGSRGSLWLAKGRKEHIPTTKVTAVDSTGAGDAYVGCFAASLAAGMDPLKGLQRAAKYAAQSVTRKGTQDSYLTKAEFEA